MQQIIYLFLGYNYELVVMTMKVTAAALDNTIIAEHYTTRQWIDYLYMIIWLLTDMSFYILFHIFEGKSPLFSQKYSRRGSSKVRKYG